MSTARTAAISTLVPLVVLLASCSSSPAQQGSAPTASACPSPPQKFEPGGPAQAVSIGENGVRTLRIQRNHQFFVYLPTAASGPGAAAKDKSILRSLKTSAQPIGYGTLFQAVQVGRTTITMDDPIGGSYTVQATVECRARPIRPPPERPAPVLSGWTGATRAPRSPGPDSAGRRCHLPSWLLRFSGYSVGCWL